MNGPVPSLSCIDMAVGIADLPAKQHRATYVLRYREQHVCNTIELFVV